MTERGMRQTPLYLCDMAEYGVLMDIQYKHWWILEENLQILLTIRS